ncbi:MAG: universal stress protein [Candidatus Dormibacteria bacterium]
MYTSIYVALDNSEHSDAGTSVAVRLAEAFSARCIGMHVYAARMHDYRFKQMEYTLPDEYQDEAELLRQRRIHDSLITTGLQLISESYTDVMRYRCLEREIPFEARARDGRNWEELVADINETRPDLVVMGALGTGAVKDSHLGSVADRVVRRIRSDSLVVRRTGDAAMAGDIIVAIDGSPQSFGGLQVALGLGKALGKRVEAVAVYDPYLHYSVFNGIVDVLSEKASKVFRFKEQEALHEEIIDSGLAQIYESHLRVAQAQAAELGVELPITLLDGKAFQRVARYASEREAWLLVCGRVGVHSPPEMDLGSNTDHLVRNVECNVLVCNRTYVPPIDMRAEKSVVWTPEAEAQMDGVPTAARGLARTAVLHWCTERGHSVVSSGDVDSALDELMPYRRTMRRIEEVRSTLDAATAAMLDEPAPESARAICRVCGYAARTDAPARCPVCGGKGDMFEQIDVADVIRAASDEGEMASDTFDGHKLSWTLEARTLLQQLPAGYLRRRVKAIVEKTARTHRLPAITADVAAPFVLPEVQALDAGAGPHRAPLGADAGAPSHGDARGRLPWSPEAQERLERIPGGFLRSLAGEQVERLALALKASEVTLLHAEAGIAEARARMQTDPEPKPASGCPVHRGQNGDGASTRGALNEVTAPVIDALGRRQIGTGELARAGDVSLP